MATVTTAPDGAIEVLRPSSEQEAVEVFGDGTDVLVVGGGTIVLPELTVTGRRGPPGGDRLLGS